MLVLGRAELQSLADPSVAVEIPSLAAMPRRRARSGVLVGPFEGDEFPTAFRSQARTGTFDLTCRYWRKTAEQRVRLEWLIDEFAPAQFPTGLLLRTHIEPGLGLSPELQEFLADGAAVAVEVFDLLSTPLPGLAWDLTFTAQRIQHEFTLDG